MKILYVANDRRAAELAGFVLRTVAPDVAVAWVAALPEAGRWADANRDVAALIAEVEPDDPACASFITGVRGLGITAPVIVVSQKSGPGLSAVTSAADQVIAKDVSFLHDLPDIVRRALQMRRTNTRPERQRLRLLYAGDAGLARECIGRPGGSIEVVQAPAGPNGTLDFLLAGAGSAAPPPFEILLVEHGHPGVDALAILRGMDARKFHVPVVIVADWDEDLAVRALKLGAADYIVKSRASFRAILFRLRRLIAHSTLLNEQSKVREAHVSALDQERSVREGLERRLAEAQHAARAAEQRLKDTATAIEQARHDRVVNDAAAADHHARLESEFAARLAQATTATEILEHHLADRDVALRTARVQAAAEQEALSQEFARRQIEQDAALAEHAAQNRILETRLAEAEASRHAAEEGRLAESAALAATVAQQQAKFKASLAQAVRSRDTLAEQLREAVTAIEQARQGRAADAAAAVQHLAQRKAVLISELCQAATTQEQLEKRLAAAETTLLDAERRAATEQHALRQQAADRQVRIEAELAQEISKRKVLSQQLADTRLAFERLEARHASETTAAETRSAEQRAQYDALVLEAATAQQSLHVRLAGAEAALQRAEEDHASLTTAAEARFAEQRAQSDARASEAAAAQRALQAQLTAAQASLQKAEEQHALEVATATEHFEDLQRHSETMLAEARAAAATLEARLVESIAAFTRAEEQAAAERQAAIEHGSRRQAAFDAQIAEELAARQALSNQLRAQDAALQNAAGQHAAEIARATARLKESQELADARLVGASTAIAGLRTRLADKTEAIARLERHAAAERQSASEDAARRQARFEADLTQEANARQALALELADARQEQKRAEERHASAIADASARLAEYRGQAEAQLARTAADAARALQAAVEQASVERQAAAGQAEERQKHVETELEQEVARRTALEEELAAANLASQAERQRFQNDLGEMRLRASERDAQFDERTTRARAEWESIRLKGLERIRQLQAEGDLARESLASAEEGIQRLEGTHQEARAAFERDKIATEADLARRAAEHTALQELFDRTRWAAQETLDQLSKDRAAERAKLTALVAERDTELHDMASRKRASDETAAATRADLEHRLRLALDDGHRDRRDIAQLQAKVAQLSGELAATTRLREVLKAQADHVPQLRKQIEEMRAQRRREFDHTPVSTCRCSRDGKITRGNQALATMLGYRTPDEVSAIDLGATVFESGDELQWIVDRCLASRSTESIETTWRRKNGSRIIVRLLAVASTADSIDLTAQDITPIRELEERLRNSQRMEAVARYSSEVAVTCHNLLRHVKQEGQQWLDAIDSDSARYRGELLLDEVTRASSFLGQLAVYGREQKNAPDLVDLNKVFRDLAPVLRRVAGNNIELVLPTVSEPLNLDVDAERVEQMLVNVAAYGRERMRLGGRLTIEVASVVVDRQFVAKYPNVRPGAHVLLTVTETMDVVAPASSGVISAAAPAVPATTPSSDSPGVDLGALQALVTNCGGHLWIMAAPRGDMVLKIHLPRRVLDRPDPRLPLKRPGRPHWINRAFGPHH